MGPRHRSTAFGYAPALDGLRAVSVAAVLLYHAGFSWMSGGFFGVEVFFVVSGFLITSLLITERERTGTVALGRFWLRRARRLLPAFIAVLIVVAGWASVAGSAEQRAQVRRDVPWALIYAGNWGQIVGDVPYFAGEPSMLRHLWSLGVEEQWYLVWPLVLVGLLAAVRSRRVAGALVLGAAVLVMLGTYWLHATLPVGPDRTNLLYLSTPTRCGGLLLGAGAALLRRPGAPRFGRTLDGAAIVASVGLLAASVTAVITDDAVYRWLLAAVSVLSLVVVLAVMHPQAWVLRWVLSGRALVAVGVRSYGLYLWSWPIFVVLGATEGSVVRFALALGVSAAVTEASYRWIEMPLRQGGPVAVRRVGTLAPATGLLVGALLAFYVTVPPFDRFRGTDTATFDTYTALGAQPTVPAPITTRPTVALVPEPPPPESSAAQPPPPEPPPPASISLTVVGDSTANALAVNQPAGISSVFPSIVNGSIDGCGVYDRGSIRTAAGVRNTFEVCAGWQQKWAQSAQGTDVSLVVIGAWEMFDVVDAGRTYPFDTPEADELFTRQLRSGVDALLTASGHVGLLEVPCMRPVESAVSGLPPLPERGDDARVAHLNALMRQVADAYGPRVAVVSGPGQWCSDPAVATDTALRWDGVHVYGRGAKLIFEAVAAQLLRLSVQR